MEADALAKFRTADDASIAETIARCDKPDLLVRIAFQCSEHRRYVIAQAASAVTSFRGELRRMAAMLSPWPDRLETLEVWADGDDSDTPRRDKVRARMVGFSYAFVVVMLADWLVWSDRLSDGLRLIVGKASFWGLSILFIPLARAVWHRGMQRQTALLDEQSALELVLARLKKAAARDPSQVPWALFMLHRAYADLLPRDGEPDTFQWPDVPPNQNRRAHRWAATFDSHDPARNVCYYRIQLFKRKHQRAHFMAEIPADFKELAWGGRFTAVRTLLAPIVATGKTNTSFVGAIT